MPEEHEKQTLEVQESESEDLMIDIHLLAEEIFRLLKRELTLENERRGL